MLLSDRAPSACARILAWCDRRPLRAEVFARRLLAATPPDSQDHPWALLTLGWCLMVREQLEEASTSLERAEEGLRAIGATAGVLRARHALLLVGLLRRLSADALPAWETLAEEYDAAGLRQEAVRARIGTVRCLVMLWRGTEALERGRAVQHAVGQFGTPQDHALLNRMLGAAHMQLGHFLQAEAALAAAETAFRRLRLGGELARTWAEQAVLAIRREDFRAARALFERASQVFRRLDMPLRLAYMEMNLGYTATRLGQFDRAIAHLLAAREHFAALNQPRNVAECTLNLGITAFYSGLFELALASWRQTEAQYTRFDMPLLALTSRRNQAEALFRLGQLDAAADLLAALIPVAEQLDARSDLGEILHVLGELHHARGELHHARTALLRAERIFADLPNRPAAARARLAQGWLALSAGAVAEAEQQFQQALGDLEASPIYRWRAIYGQGRCAELQNNPDSALAHYREACAEVARLRGRLAESHASSALFREASELVDTTIRLAAARGEALSLLQVAEQHRAMVIQQQLQREPVVLPPALQAAYEARRAELRAAAVGAAQGPGLEAALTAYLELLLHGRHATMPAHTEEAREEVLDLDALRTSLSAQYGDAWTTLIYVAMDDQLLALTLTATQLQLTHLPIDQRLRRLLERACLPRYRAYTYQDLSFHNGQRTEPWADLAALGETLLPPEVRSRLRPDHRLLIVPGGPLHSLPWAALRVDGSWLVERAVIQLIPSLQLWANLTQQPTWGSDALLIGVSQFAGRAAELASALPSLHLAQRLWPGITRRLEGPAVTRAALREAAAAGELRRFGLIHIATHGQLLSGRGALAHLKLADDDLLADEVAQLNLRGALVVLAACEGALGETLPGEELVSLSWALLAGGAGDVVASLWQLYDLMVLPILEPLYAALAAGCDAPTALAKAQRACISVGREEPDASLGMPFIWASLCVTGAGARR
jgi:CHAT domain-containing protein